MKWKEAIRKCEWVIFPLVLVLASFFSGSYYGQRKVLSTAETKRDTVVKVVTVYKDFPQPQKTAQIGYVAVPAYKFITDTVTNEIPVFLHDTTVVYLPREQKYYEEADGKLRLWVSGYEPRLDRYEYDVETVTVTNTIKIKPSRLSISISGGYGAGMQNGRVILSPYFGFGLSYALLWL